MTPNEDRRESPREEAVKPTAARLEAPPVFTDRVRDYYRDVESFQRASARSSRRLTRVALAVSVVLSVLLCLLGGALVYALPLIRVVPVFVYARPDGTIEAAVTPGSLPPDVGLSQQLSAVWQFVRLYEGYSEAESEYSWNVVSAMAAKQVSDRYRADHDPRNKDAPINAIGDKAVVHVEYVSMEPACETCANRYNVRFERTVKRSGDPRPERSKWVATVQWTTDLADRFDFRQRITFNAPGIVVTDYPGAQREDIPR